MADLTRNEEAVLRIVRRQCRHGDPVASADVKTLARPISYDMVDRALRGLLAKDLVTRPTRGNWLPVAGSTGGETA